ncbi:pseudouridine synthase [Polaribacter sp.]|nr:pseudouridine synthase [Polaribacter sp.]
MNLDIIFEDEWLLCVNKPNNMVVHHAYFSRNVIDEMSLLQFVEKEKNIKVFPIHRLDRRTSGIILLAKQKEYVAEFQKLFEANKIEKKYYGVVRGFSPEEKLIDAPVKGKDKKEYKDAITLLKTLDNITLDIPVKPYDTSRYSLVELIPKTGRTHQLRIHTYKNNHPLVGDTKYGDINHNAMFVKEFQMDNLFLHAGKLEFQHPKNDKFLKLKAKFPKDWIALFEKFDWENPL